MSFPRPTALGVKAALFYLLILGAFYAARYSNLFFLLVVFLTVLAVHGLLAARRNLAGVTGRFEEIEPTAAGTGAEVRAHVGAEKRARFGLGVELRIDGAAPYTIATGYVDRELSVSGRLPPLPRGIYPITSANVVTTWPLGLFRFRRAVDAPERVVVFPTPAPRETPAAGGVGLGELLSRQGSAGMMQPSHLREYRPGDELRRVHWKASARRRNLVVQEWEGGTGAGHEIVLDRRTSNDGLEEALSLLSALALAAKEEKEPLTLHSQGLDATFGANFRPWEELFAFLAAADALPRNAEAPPVAAPYVPRLGGTA